MSVGWLHRLGGQGTVSMVESQPMPGGLCDVSKSVDLALLTGQRECVCVLFFGHICNECNGADTLHCAWTRVYACA